MKSPIFKERIQFAKPAPINLSKYATFLDKINQSGKLTNNGPFLRQFEDKIAATVNAKYCIGLANATSGLQILASLQKQPYIPVASFTFPATYQAICAAGKIPQLIDTAPNNHHFLDLLFVQDIVFAVNIWGNTCPLPTFEEILVYFDSAHAFGRKENVRGKAEVFSFHATKIVNCGEGGAIVTNDENLAQELLLLRNFGILDKHGRKICGINAKMSEMAAAWGLLSLENLDQQVEHNKNNYFSYLNGLKDVKNIKFCPLEEKHPNFQYIVLEVEENKRDLLWKSLEEHNIESKCYFPYPELVEPHSLPETWKLSQKVLCLPTGHAINSLQINKICDLIAEIMG